MSKIIAIKKDIGKRIKELEKRVVDLENIKYKYYCLGFVYFIILVYFILFPLFGNLFELTDSYLFLITFIYFSIIFFGELLYKGFKSLIKSKKE